MSDAGTEHVYRKIELVGSSPDGIEAAIRAAIGRAGQTLRHLRWFEVTEIRGHVEQGAVAHYQVTLKAGFTVEESVMPLQPGLAEAPALAEANIFNE